MNQAWLSQADVVTFAPHIASCIAMVGEGTAQEMIKRLWHPDLISRAVAFGFRARREDTPPNDVTKDMVGAAIEARQIAVLGGPVRGRVVAYMPELTDLIGLAEETEIVDWQDAPAPELWIGWQDRGGGLEWNRVLAWIPIELCERAEHATKLTPIACLEWASDVVEIGAERK